MMMALWNLFISFGRSTLLGFGGGPSTVPLYEHETVEVFHWLTREEFGQALALANTLPGPIATKLGMYIGHKVAGWAGAFVALMAVTLPTGLALVGLFSLLSRFKDAPFFKGMIGGIRPVIFVMLAMLAWEFARYAFEPVKSSAIAFLPFGIAAGYFISVQYLNVSPLWGVVSSLVLGGIFLR